MDITEFTRQQPPRAKRSRLEPYLAQILELRAKGYVNTQICEWLATNDVRISAEGLRKFLKKQEAGSSAPSANSPAPAPSRTVPPSTAQPVGKPRITNPGDLHKAINREIDLDDAPKPKPAATGFVFNPNPKKEDLL